MREYNARRTSTFKLNATIQEHEAKKEYERNKKKQQRANETPQQREARLEKMRDYDARRNSTEDSTEKCKKKSTPAFPNTKEYDRNQKRIQRERETPEQREERLQKAREYKATYKRKATPKEKEATVVRVAAAKANWTEEQIAKDKEAAKKRMADVRSRRTVEEYTEEQQKQRERRMGQPNWRRREHDRWEEEAWEERKRKLASGKWKENERNGTLEAIDPENLEWDCPAGPECRCHYMRTCKRCKRSFYGCQAFCPSKICREREEQEREEQEREEKERETSIKDQDEMTDNPKPSTSRIVELYSYAPTVNIPEEMSEYDKVRQKNIEERQRKFRELGLNEAKQC